MRIVSAEVIPIALPFRELYVTASGELTSRSMAILRLHAPGGDVGLGEAVPMSLRGGPGIEAVASELEVCAEVLTGADAEPASGGQRGPVREWVRGLLARCESAGAHRQALCAVDGALHDLAGRIAGVPVWSLLGAVSARPVSCNATLDAGAPAAVGAEAEAAAGAGFGTFKVKVGVGDDLARVAAVREATGRAARIRIDANGAWSVDDALQHLAELAGIGLELVEQPCAGVAELARVRAQCDVPVVADESVASREDAELALATGACDAATLKLSKVGGPLRALEIGEIVPSYLSSALDGPIGVATAVHTAGALRSSPPAAGFAHGLATLDMFADTYAPCDELAGPSITPGDGPGLGVEIDEARLEELRIR